MKPSLATRSGKLIDLNDPNPEHFTLEDIAAGLARQHRFAGQMDMTVAQHSVNVMRVVQDRGGSPSQIIQALFHDASEFLIADIPRPLKVKLPQYYEYEMKLMQAIALKFDFAWPACPLVKMADEILLCTEAVNHLHPDVRHAINPDYGFPANLADYVLSDGEWYGEIVPPGEAEIAFLLNARLLLSERDNAIKRAE